MQQEGAKARRERGLYRVAIVLAGLLVAGVAEAHAVGMSQSAFVVDGARVHAEIVVAKAEASALLRGASDDDLRDVVENGIAVSADGEACAASFEKAETIEADGFAIDAVYTCSHAPREVAVTLYLLSELPRGHRHLARIEAGDASSQALLDAEHRGLSLVIPRAEAPSTGSVFRTASTTIALGIEHILLGWDHLLFLFALLLVAARLRVIVGMISAFTVAHSITLGLAALGVVRVSPTIVEPLIAASIAFVAFDNVAKRHAPRIAITFVFGLIHGFGFAGALDALRLAADRIPPALLGFNVGVELGQLAVILAIAPILAALRTRGWLGDRVVRRVSIALGVFALGLVALRLTIRPL